MDSTSSNRTFMELKSDELPPPPMSHHRSNRTFMELKFELFSGESLNLLF